MGTHRRQMQKVQKHRPTSPWGEHTLELQNALVADIQKLDEVYQSGKESVFNAFSEKQQDKLHMHLGHFVTTLRDWNGTWNGMVDCVDTSVAEMTKWQANLTPEAVRHVLSQPVVVAAAASASASPFSAAPPCADTATEGSEDASSTAYFHGSTGSSSVVTSPAEQGDSVDEAGAGTGGSSKTTGGDCNYKTKFVHQHPALKMLNDVEQLRLKSTKEHWKPKYAMDRMVYCGNLLISQIKAVHHTRWRELKGEQEKQEDVVMKEKADADEAVAQQNLKADDIAASTLKQAPWLVFGVFGAAKIAADTYSKYSKRCEQYAKLDAAEAELKEQKAKLEKLDKSSQDLENLVDEIVARLCKYGQWWNFILHDWERYDASFVAVDGTVREILGDESRKEAKPVEKQIKKESSIGRVAAELGNDMFDMRAMKKAGANKNRKVNFLGQPVPEIEKKNPMELLDPALHQLRSELSLALETSRTFLMNRGRAR
eukprot:g878.t1